jgi:hypothetical protein
LLGVATLPHSKGIRFRAQKTPLAHFAHLAEGSGTKGKNARPYKAFALLLGRITNFKWRLAAAKLVHAGRLASGRGFVMNRTSVMDEPIREHRLEVKAGKGFERK